MKALKKACLGSMVLAGGFMLAMGSFNSIVVNNDAFMKDDFGIRFAKRLDEMNGEIVRGRITASIPKFESTKKVEIAASVLKVQKEVVKKSLAKKEKDEIHIEEESKIKGDYDNLALTGGLMGQDKNNKIKIEANKNYTGSISKIVDGTIEGLEVSLPDGRSFDINTVGRIKGNFFKYEDTETRELQTGLVYGIVENEERGEAVILVQLTSDTNLAGASLEFKTDGVAKSPQPKAPTKTQNIQNNVAESEVDHNDNLNAYENLIKENDQRAAQLDKEELEYQDEENKELNLENEKSEGSYNFNFEQS